MIHGLLAAIFGIAALSKAIDRPGATAAVRSATRELSPAAAGAAVSALIGLELVVAIGLLSPVPQVFAFIAFGFLVATGALVVRDLPQGGADCGCFGRQLGLRGARLRLVRHFVFLGLALAATMVGPSGSPLQLAAGAIVGITLVLLGPLVEAALALRPVPS
jgi:hypothetical protein